MHGYLSLYFPSYVKAIVALARANEQAPKAYLKRYWRTVDFSKVPTQLNKGDVLYQLTLAGIGMQILIGLAMISAELWGSFTGGVAFGLATIVAYPLLWGHLLFIGLVVNRAPRYAKNSGKNLVCVILEHQIKKLRSNNDFIVVAVAGSVGKTSTKMAIAQLLAEEKKVIYQVGNYNDPTTVPLVFFGKPQPALFNVFAWLKVFMENSRQLKQPYPYDVVVVELGTDEPGVMRRFAYVRPDLTVLTAITDEHMERFKTLDGVANEELKVFAYSKQILLNADDVPPRFREGKNYETYSLKQGDYKVTAQESQAIQGQKLHLDLQGTKIQVVSKLLGNQGAKAALAAAAVAIKLGLKPSNITRGLEQIEAFSGRMKVLSGIRSSLIIDDTYNASPAAVKAALDVLYAAKAPQKIAVLGSMNELGETSQISHEIVGKYCDKTQLDEVVTIGMEAEKWLAPAAQQAGCKVSSFSSPYAAGEYVAERLKKGAVILAKGSQNGVFAEEAVKLLLKDTADSSKLVRQSTYWLGVKRKQFHDAA